MTDCCVLIKRPNLSVLSGESRLSQVEAGGEVEELLLGIINGPVDDSMVGGSVGSGSLAVSRWSCAKKGVIAANVSDQSAYLVNAR